MLHVRAAAVPVTGLLHRLAAEALQRVDGGGAAGEAEQQDRGDQGARTAPPAHT
ncbi:hypothetical protein [Streptomyces venezuelae]|uniref:hypothetical protein n=1 Tax=Streptomyces venezuelae TaxID=54571 RepID=UPI00168CD1F9|nr:hypothetical protein [Streptomyces venezuelae]